MVGTHGVEDMAILPRSGGAAETKGVMIMVSLERLWLGVLTRNVEDAGTDDRIVLIINQNGTDVVHHTFPDTQQEDLERGLANLYTIGGLSVSTNDVNNSSVRVGIRGSDAWRPEHLVLWGRIDPQQVFSPYYPVAIELDITKTLSTDAKEGVTSIPMHTVERGGSDVLIRRLLVLMTTRDQEDAGTDSKVALVTNMASGQVTYTIPDTSQDDQERGDANLYFFRVAAPFTRRELIEGSMRLRILGNDAWTPGSLFVFGLDTASGRPRAMVPLVHEAGWSPLDVLSTDANEGKASVELHVIEA